MTQSLTLTNTTRDLSPPSGVVHPASSTSLRHVDALRGVAICMVILTHSTFSIPALPQALRAVTSFGQMGVQLFFVVSAYTLCLSASRRRGETRALTSFAIRRLFRVAPMYYVAIVLYSVIAATDGMEAHTSGLSEPVLSSILWNASFLHGFVPSANNSVVPGGWSIGTEMAFYAIFPLLFATLLAARKRFGSKVIGVSVVLAVALNEIVQAISAAITGQSIANNTFMYFNLVNQLPVFLIGMGLFFIHDARPSLQPRTLWLSTGLFLSVGLTLIAAKTLGNRAFQVIPLFTGISFVFLFELFRRGSVRWPKFLERIGQLSYSMYILHFLVAWSLAVKVAGPLSRTLPPLVHWGVVLIFCFASTIALARATERWIERPGIACGRRVLARLTEKSPVRVAPRTAGESGERDAPGAA